MHHFNVFQGLKIFFKIRIFKKETIHLNKYGRINLRTNSSDADIFNQVFLDKEYDIDMPYQPKFIIDAGANIGLTSIFLAHKFPLSKIISIEPETQNFDLLQRNTATLSNVYSLKKALWITDGKIALSKSSSNDSHQIKEMEENSELVNSITLKTILNEYNPGTIDILKMDVEGAEKEIFSVDTENWLPRVAVLIIELHDRIKPGCSMNLFNALNGYDYTMSVKGELLIFRFNNF